MPNQTGSNPVGTAYKDIYSKSLFNHQTFNPETINFLYPEHLRRWPDREAADSKSVIWGFESLTARLIGAEMALIDIESNKNTQKTDGKISNKLTDNSSNKAVFSTRYKMAA